ncbi:MAG: translocation/assembly module TamB domain-containing protein [Polyangiaceae bacterium]
MKRFPRLRRGLLRAALGGLVGLCFVCFTLLGVRLHLNLPRSRQLIRSQVNQLLESTFQGELRITRLRRVSLGEIQGVDGYVLPPGASSREEACLRFWDTSASISLTELLASLWKGTEPVDVHLPDVHIRAVHVRLETNDAGELNLAGAFQPPTQTEVAPQGASRGVEVAIDRVRIDSSWTHGSVAGSPPLDADLNQAVARFDYARETLHLKLERGQLAARRLPQQLDPQGDVNGSLKVTANAELDASLDFDGRVMQSPVMLSAAYSPSGVRLQLESKRLALDALRRYGLDPPAQAERRLEISGSGPLSDVNFRGALQLGSSELRWRGQASLLAPGVELSGRLSKLDLRDLRQDLPRTEVGGGLDVDFKLTNGQPRVTSRLALAPSSIEGWRLPALSAEGHLEGARVWAFVRTAPTTSTPRGATLRADAQLDLEHLDRGIAFNASVRAPRLSALRRYAALPSVEGDVRAEACGTVYPEGSRLDADASIHSGRLEASGFVVRRAHLSASLAGPLGKPRLSSTLRAAALRSEQPQLSRFVDFANLRASVRGNPDMLRARIELPARRGSRAPGVEASARIAPAEQRVTAARASITRAARRVDVSVARVDFGSSLAVSGAKLTGAGALEGDLRVGTGRLESSLRARRLDLAVLSQLLEGLPGLDPPISGIVDGRVDLEGSASAPRGSIQLEIEQASRGQDSFSGQVHLVADSGQLDGRIQLHAARIGSLMLAPRDVKPNGVWTDPRAWLASSGKLRSDFAIDSEALLARLGQDTGFDVVGLVRGHVELERETAAAFAAPLGRLPSVRAKWSSVGLRVGGGGAQKRRGPLLQGIDFRGEFAADGATGDTELTVDAIQGERRMMSLEATSRIPYARWLRSGSVSKDELLGLPLSAHLKSEALPMAELPELVRVPGLDGRLELDAKLEGSVLTPDFRLDFRGTKLDVDELSRRQGLASVGYLEYREGVARLRFGLSSRFRSLVRAQAKLELAMRDALRGDLSRARADGKLVVDQFGLAAVPALRAREVRGRASGVVELEGIGGPNPKAKLQLDVPKGRIGESKFNGVSAQLDLTRDHAQGSVLMEQADGFGQVLASAGLEWEGLLPRLAWKRRARVKLLANGWRLEALEPFVRGQVDQLDGRVDADARLDLIPGATKLDGFVRVRDGVLQIPTLGQQLKNLEAQLDLSPDGSVRLDGGSVEGLSGKAYFDAAAKLDGLNLVAANAKLRIPEKEALPITYQGVPLGDGSGAVDLKARLTPKEDRFDVDVSHFEFQLPRKPHTGVQSLEPDPRIRIGAHGDTGFVPLIGPGAEEREPTGDEGARTLVRVDLGDHFEVKQGTDLRVHLGGKLRIDSARKRPVAGQIRLDGGSIDISGKIFEIEQGVISFQDDPSNPVVVARAAWDSPAGYKVVAEYAGPLKNGNFKLRAEPALSQNEIVSLILFGTPDGTVGSSGSGGGPGAAQAASVGAGVATAPLNRAISDVTSLDIATRVDTSDAQGPRPELVVQLTPRVSAQVGYNLEEPKPGKAPDRTLFSLEFRIASRWSLATTFGDGGSSLVDLVWRYRY